MLIGMAPYIHDIQAAELGGAGGFEFPVYIRRRFAWLNVQKIGKGAFRESIMDTMEVCFCCFVLAFVISVTVSPVHGIFDAARIFLVACCDLLVLNVGVAWYLKKYQVATVSSRDDLVWYYILTVLVSMLGFYLHAEFGPHVLRRLFMRCVLVTFYVYSLGSMLLVKLADGAPLFRPRYSRTDVVLWAIQVYVVLGATGFFTFRIYRAIHEIELDYLQCPNEKNTDTH